MGMKCLFCNGTVVNKSPITIPGEGFAHSHCFQTDQALKRTFQSLNISKLDDTELTELKEMVIAEENTRNHESDDIDLF